MKWVVFRGEEVDVIPIRDLIEHELGRQCDCHPRLEPNLKMKTLVIHNAIDGRE